MKKILVALDGSERASYVFETALQMAKQFDAKLILFRAVSLPIGVPVEVYSANPDNLGTLLLENAEKELKVYAEKLGSVSGETVCRLDSPWYGICEVAEEYEVDMVVIGSHGYQFVDRLLGTTAARVVNHAKCSVLVVRDKTHKESK